MIKVKASVSLGVMINLSQPWTGEVSFNVVHERAAREAREKLNRLIASNSEFSSLSVKVDKVSIHVTEQDS